MYIEETVITGPTVELKGKKLQGCTSRLNDSTVNWRYCGSETQNAVVCACNDMSSVYEYVEGWKCIQVNVRAVREGEINVVFFN